MTMKSLLRPWWAVVAAALLSAPGTASAHFLWLTVNPAGSPRDGATVRAFLNEEPEPGGPQFLKPIRNVIPTVDGRPLAVTVGERTIDAHWAGKLPASIDAECDLGIKKDKTGKVYRLYYTARAQTVASAAAGKEGRDKLRVRLITRDGKGLVQVLFDGKPVASARIKIYPTESESRELIADAEGLASIDGVAEGKTALWANWVEPKAGEVDGKAFAETRHYATFTFHPTPSTTAGSAAACSEVPTAFATMPAPAVNSFGGAVLGDWLYVYSGHIGKVHQYSVETTSRHFRRLSLKDRTTWEDLPMGPDLQGLPMVTDGRYLYRVGGMSARNKPGEETDLHSVADFARFDPQTRTWTNLAPMPRPRSTHDAVVIGRTVYAVGGWTMKGATEEAVYLEDAVAFDLDKPDAGWRSIPQPFRRRALSVGEAGGKLYVLGGLTDSFKVDRRVDVYDPATGCWSRGPDLPGAGRTDGFGTSAFGVDGRLYFSGAQGRIFRLDAQAGRWEAAGGWSQPRITHRLLPGPDHALLAVGGNTAGKPTPVIEAVVLPAPGPVKIAGTRE